ncbi:hypothetical protein MCUN1_000335 [Malassezia cuniculi]|uniref:Uncharacterized protein n=1 Tax=Malassezia cuniculi TaxID=948313 RepID=A0AAF0J4K7_9BASI|nr:hypothetical protein MCUN1_000335 [Malassezia cuniculi]
MQSGMFKVFDALAKLGVPLPVPSLLHGRLLPIDPPLGKYLASVVSAAGLGVGLTALPYAGSIYLDTVDRAWRRHGSRLQFWRNIIVVRAVLTRALRQKSSCFVPA